MSHQEDYGDSLFRDGDSDSGNDSDDKDFFEQILSDPLALIDENANLEDVLSAKTIGEAMQILCPNIPGLPTKARGKYQKRRLLTEEQKLEVLRATNRENARLTRKRKKIYNEVISSLLTTLHQTLGSDVVKKSLDISNLGPSAAINHIQSLANAAENDPKQWQQSNVNNSANNSSNNNQSPQQQQTGQPGEGANKRRRGRPRKYENTSNDDKANDESNNEISEILNTNNSTNQSNNNINNTNSGNGNGNSKRTLLDTRKDIISKYLAIRCDRDLPFRVFSSLQLEYSMEGYVRVLSANGKQTHGDQTKINNNNIADSSSAASTLEGASVGTLIDRWNATCHRDMTHSMPLPIYRTLSPLAEGPNSTTNTTTNTSSPNLNFNSNDSTSQQLQLPPHQSQPPPQQPQGTNRYECRGPQAILDDSSRMMSFFQWVVQCTRPEDASWFIECEIVPDSFLSNPSCDRISFDYTFVLWTESSIAKSHEQVNGNADGNVGANDSANANTWDSTDCDATADGKGSNADNGNGNGNNNNDKALLITSEFGNSNSSNLPRRATTNGSGSHSSSQILLDSSKETSMEVDEDSTAREKSTDNENDKNDSNNDSSTHNNNNINSTVKHDASPVYHKILEISCSAMVDFATDGRLTRFFEEFDVLQILLMREKLTETHDAPQTM